MIDWFDDALKMALPKCTPRERQIIDLLSEGLSQSEVARRLGISRQTVGKKRDMIRFRILKAKQAMQIEELLPKKIAFA